MNRTPFIFAFMACVLSATGAAAGERHIDPGSGIEFVLIPAGCFAMGAARSGVPDPVWPVAVPAADEVPKHEVCLRAFWLSKSEVTRGQWNRVFGKGLPGVDLPVAGVSWTDATSFAQTLSATGAGRFRLPTEAEWEYACRAGSRNDEVQVYDEDLQALYDRTLRFAWYRYQSGRDPTAYYVMGKEPNAWGLHDMLGNVWEWTLDGYGDAAYASHAGHDPRHAAVDDRKVIRGGSYKSDVSRVRCGARSYAPDKDRSPVIGFRLVKEYDPLVKQGVER